MRTSLFINLRRHFTMEKAQKLENKTQVFEYLKNLNIDFKTYEHTKAKTVQDIIGRINKTPSGSSRSRLSSRT
jgi:hypothetical protein